MGGRGEERLGCQFDVDSLPQQAGLLVGILDIPRESNSSREA